MINQISTLNIFSHIVTAISSLIGIANTLTDGPTFTGNGEIKLTGTGALLNVRNNAIVSTNVVAGTINTVSATVTGSSTALYANGESRIGNGQTTGITNALDITITSAQVQGGTLTLDTMNAVNANVTTLTVGTLTHSTGVLTLAQGNLTSVNATSGNVTLSTLNASVGIISTLKSNITNSVITTATANGATLTNCTISGVTGFTKSDIGLGNVDNTSDAEKNSATANLTNKTLDAPLIITGNTSANATLPLHVACKYDVDDREEEFNPIINGNMQIWQRGTSSSGSNTYLADRFTSFTFGGFIGRTMRQSNNVPTVANSGILFNYSLECDVLIAEPGPLNSTYRAFIAHRIEGYNWRHFAQKDFVLSFWVMSTKTGTYTVAFRSSASPQNTYLADYTINVSDTWEYKTIAVPASPDNAGWRYSEGIGLEIVWPLFTGSNFRSNTTGSWISGASAAVYSSANQVNALDSSSNFFRLTGVQMNKGTTAKIIQPRLFQDELRLCERYYQKSFNYSTAPDQNIGQLTGEALFMSPVGAGVTANSPLFQFPTPMRTAPTMIFYNPFALNGEVRNEDRGQNCSSLIARVTETGFSVRCTTSASTVAGDTLGIHWTAETEL